MTDPNQPIDPGVTADAGSAASGAEEPVEAEVVPEEQETASPGAAPGGASVGDDTAATSDSPDAPEADVHPDTTLAAERLADLQRLQAEYVNYKRRVDRDRADIQIRAAHDVLETLLPVLDEIQLADQHGDLPEGSPVRTITDKLQQALGKYGLERVGAKGEPFDPNVHEALMHSEWDPADPDLPTGATETTIVTVLQPGYRAGERVLRAARVAVADPQ